MLRRYWVFFGFLLLVAGVAGNLVSRNLNAEAVKAPSLPADAIERLHATTLLDTAGRATTVGNWRGKILIVNFWATWCPPCRKEMPAFSRMHDKFAPGGVQFVGIGIDSPSAIKEFALQAPVSYPLLVAGAEGLELARALGNPGGALPFTLVLDRQGQPVFSRLGMVQESELEALLARLSGT